MSDIERAKHLFQEAGLAFPAIPDELATRLKDRRQWEFSTRTLLVSPYSLQHYLAASEGTQVEDYAVLAHAGHGVNSCAIHYYLVQDKLRMFLQLLWGGAYVDSRESAAKIRECFSMADRLAAAVHAAGRFQSGGWLTVVASDLCGSWWLGPEESSRSEDTDGEPLEALAGAVDWLAKQGLNHAAILRSKTHSL